jgi:hypothetical protein
MPVVASQPPRRKNADPTTGARQDAKGATDQSSSPSSDPLEFEFGSLFEFDPLSSWFRKILFRKRSKPSSATAGAAANVVAMHATVAALVMVVLGGFLLCKKQPSVTASG